MFILYLCCISCEKLLRSELEAQIHAAESGHQMVSRTVGEAKALTEEGEKMWFDYACLLQLHAIKHNVLQVPTPWNNKESGWQGERDEGEENIERISSGDGAAWDDEEIDRRCAGKVRGREDG